MNEESLEGDAEMQDIAEFIFVTNWDAWDEMERAGPRGSSHKAAKPADGRAVSQSTRNA